MTKLQKNNISLFELFILAGPIIDLLTAASMKFLKINITFGMVFRFVFMLYMLYYLFFKSKSKYKSFSIIFVMFNVIYILLHTIHMFYLKGSPVIFSEITNVIKKFYFPFVLLSSLNYIDENKNLKLTKNFNYVLLFYALSILVTILLDVSFSTYSTYKIGYKGWFYSPNEIGAIIAILLPFWLFDMIKNIKNCKNKISFLIIIFVILMMGTKVPFLALVISLISYLILYLIYGIVKFENFKVFKHDLIIPVIFPIILMLIVSLLMFNFSPLKTNILKHKSNLMQNKNSLSEEDYVNLIFSSREKYNRQVYSKFKLASLSEKLYGLGHFNLTDGGQKINNVIEIDYLDIFYIFGIIGFIVYFSPILVLLFISGFCILKKLRKILLDDLNFAYVISVLLIIGVAFFAGRTIVAPSVSFYTAIIILFLFFKTVDNHNKEVDKLTCYFRKNLTKKSIVLFAISNLIIILLSFIPIVLLNKVNIEFSNNFRPKSLELINSLETDDIYNLGVKNKEQEYKYSKKNIEFSLILTERIFSTEEKIYFLTLTNNSKMPIKFFVNLTLENFAQQNFQYDFALDEIKKEHHPTFGYEKTTLPVMYLENSENYSILISKGFVYEYLIKEYENQDSSILKKLVKEINKVDLSNDKLSYKFTLLPDEKVDYYIILSQSLLFNERNSIEKYIDMLNYNRGYTSWLSRDGSYHKIPRSIEPFTEEGYSRAPAPVVAKKPWALFKSDGSEIFSILHQNSLFYLLYTMPRHVSGVWVTEYTSTWIKKDYEIRAPYIDTRFNEVIGNYIEQSGKELQNIDLQNMYYLYAEFLISKYNENNYIQFNEGPLFPDYFSDNHDKKSHASLNHQLSIVNYLLKAYLMSNNKSYLSVALKLVDTIENQSKLWIKEDKDLWYQVNEQGVYEGTDYKTLTLEDLLLTQNYLIKAKQKPLKGLTKMIKSKYEYLTDIDYEIPKYMVDNLRKYIK